MKSLKSCEMLWRDGFQKQCVYSVLMSVIIMSIVQIGFVNPKQAHIHDLRSEIKRLERLPIRAEEEMIDVQVEAEAGCMWEKRHTMWRMSGKFSKVYHCMLHENNVRAVASMRLHRHMMGVSVVLGFDEMPA